MYVSTNEYTAVPSTTAAYALRGIQFFSPPEPYSPTRTARFPNANRSVRPDKLSARYPDIPGRTLGVFGDDTRACRVLKH